MPELPEILAKSESDRLRLYFDRLVVLSILLGFSIIYTSIIRKYLQLSKYYFSFHEMAVEYILNLMFTFTTLS